MSSIFFAGTADKNPFIRFAASFCGLDWLKQTTKKFIVINGLNSRFHL